MTAQIHEKLIYEGVETSIAGCPDLPENHPRLIKFSEDYWRPGFYINTACWRKYVGTWEVRDGKFYLSAIEGFYRIEGSEPIFADWVTDQFRVPRGEILDYFHAGFMTVFEQELLLRVENGMVVETRLVDNRGKDLDTIYRDLGYDSSIDSEGESEGESIAEDKSDP